jgi:adenosylcobinamide kinase/adenosylcobinamide-phosphate guanylyltransferase
MKSKRRGHITLVLGGARSGKSSYATRTAETIFRIPVYVATAEPFDGEMAERIRRHRAARCRRWKCIEEPLDLAGALRRIPARSDGVLVDCVTVWLSNVLVREGDAAVEKRCKALLAAVRTVRKDLIIVSNEVGMGIVPDSLLGRNFRDAAGRLNQDLAAAADTVVFVAAGIPMILKDGKARVSHARRNA